MKKAILIFACIAAFGTPSMAQINNEAQAPEIVLAAFAEKFADVKTVKWEQESQTLWEAEFKMKGADYTAIFDYNGQWLETEHNIKKSEIPENLKAAISKDYAGYKIEKAEMVESPAGTGYEIELEKGEEEVTLMVDTKGVISKYIEKEYDND